jgi:hypothetical protein
MLHFSDQRIGRVFRNPSPEKIQHFGASPKCRMLTNLTLSPVDWRSCKVLLAKVLVSVLFFRVWWLTCSNAGVPILILDEAHEFRER